MDLFSFSHGKKFDDKRQSAKTFAPPRKHDGAIEIESDSYVNFAQQNAYAIDIDSIPTNEAELLLTYRNLALQQEIDEAIEEIANEAIIHDDMKSSVTINLDRTGLSAKLKTRITEEFTYILRLLKFASEGYGLFRKWYVDGCLYFHKVLPDGSSPNGIVELIPIDPLHIKLVREIKKSRTNQSEVYNLADIEEYYVYTPIPIHHSQSAISSANNMRGIRIPKEAVTAVPSGLMSADGKTILSYLYKAIKPFNNLKLMEDALVIYRVSRAPERRVFYVDIGNLPKGKAEQYLKSIMQRFQNKIVYDVNRGTINNRKKFQTMMEDYWLPRRDGGRGTEVTTLPGGQNLGELDDVTYFKEKLYRSLGIPLSRFLQESTAFNLGKTTEITRDEIKFAKFIARLRNKFAELFNDLLRTQLILKRIMTPEEWSEIVEHIGYNYLMDNYFQELKQTEVMMTRIELFNQINVTGIIGKYISHDTIRRQILQQTEEEIKNEDKKIKKEEKEDKYKQDTDDDDEFQYGFNKKPKKHDDEDEKETRDQTENNPLNEEMS